MSANDNTSLHLPVVGFAIVTSVLTALANLVIENITSINVFSFSLWLVVPVGAVFIGLGGASGGMLACRYFNIKPNFIDFIVLVLIGAATMYLIYYLGYITLVLDNGAKASDYVSFNDYVDVITTKSHLRIGRGATDTGEVGGFGYFLLITKFVGVLLGGFAVFALIKDFAMCNKCNVYYKKIATKESNLMSIEQGQDVLTKIREGTVESYKDAITLAKKYTDTAKDGTKIKVKFTLMRCPKCNDSFVTEKFSAMDGASTKDLKEFDGRTNIPNGSDIAIEFKK